MNKKIRDVILAAAALAVVGGLFFWSRQTTPEQVAGKLFDMNVPARYVFVSDSTAPRLASVDMDSATLASELPLRTIANLMAVNNDYGLLAYAAGDSGDIYVRELITHAEQMLTLPHVAEGMVFDSDSTYLFVYGKNMLSIADARGGKVQTIDGFSALRSMHFNPFAREIVLLDSGDHKVKHIRLPGQEMTAADLPSSWRDFTASALSPGGEYLLFGVYDTAQEKHLAVVWHNGENNVRTYPMSAPLLQPFVDNNVTAFFFVDSEGQGIRVAGDNPDEVLAFTTVNKPSHFALGWIDTHLLVVGEAAARLYDSATLETIAEVPFPGAAQDIFITGDSKMALLTGKGSRDLLLFDVHKGGEVRAVPLGNLERPTAVLMGAGYTLCH